MNSDCNYIRPVAVGKSSSCTQTSEFSGYVSCIAKKAQKQNFACVSAWGKTVKIAAF